MTRPHGASTGLGAFEQSAFRSFCAGGELFLTRLGEKALIVRRGDDLLADLSYSRSGQAAIRLGEGQIGEGVDPADVVAAACETLLGSDPGVARILLETEPGSALGRRLVAAGLALSEADGLAVLPDLLWQQPRLWLAQPDKDAYPQRLVLENGIRHPLRPPKPQGLVYARFIPWVGRTLSFHVAAPERHLDVFNRWMNDPRVAEIWEESGDLARHRAYLEERLADPHALPLIGCFDEAPFGYFEVYWAKENRLGPHYEAHDYDRGWHVLVGEDGFRGKPWLTAWLPSLMHFIFLDDPRTQRIVGEPKASHAQQIRNLDRSGFAKVKHVDFPHKRALLVMLLRERFFGDRLWQPAAEAETPAAKGAATPALKVVSA